MATDKAASCSSAQAKAAAIEKGIMESKSWYAKNEKFMQDPLSWSIANMMDQQETFYQLVRTVDEMAKLMGCLEWSITEFEPECEEPDKLSSQGAGTKGGKMRRGENKEDQETIKCMEDAQEYVEFFKDMMVTPKLGLPNGLGRKIKDKKLKAAAEDMRITMDEVFGNELEELKKESKDIIKEGEKLLEKMHTKDAAGMKENRKKGNERLRASAKEWQSRWEEEEIRKFQRVMGEFSQFQRLIKRQLVLVVRFEQVRELIKNRLDRIEERRMRVAKCFKGQQQRLHNNVEDTRKNAEKDAPVGASTCDNQLEGEAEKDSVHQNNRAAQKEGFEQEDENGMKQAGEPVAEICKEPLTGSEQCGGKAESKKENIIINQEQQGDEGAESVGAPSTWEDNGENDESKSKAAPDASTEPTSRMSKGKQEADSEYKSIAERVMAKGWPAEEKDQKQMAVTQQLEALLEHKKQLDDEVSELFRNFKEALNKFE